MNLESNYLEQPPAPTEKFQADQEVLSAEAELAAIEANFEDFLPSAFEEAGTLASSSEGGLEPQRNDYERLVQARVDFWDKMVAEQERLAVLVQKTLRRVARLSDASDQPLSLASRLGEKETYREQTEVMSDIYRDLMAIIRENPDASLETLVEATNEILKAAPENLDDNQRWTIRDIIEQYTKKHAKIRNFITTVDSRLNQEVRNHIQETSSEMSAEAIEALVGQRLAEMKENNPDMYGSEIFHDIFGEYPDGRVEVMVLPMTIYLRCFNKKDYAYLDQQKFLSPNTQITDVDIQRSSSVGGRALYKVPVRELTGLVAIENATNAKNPEVSKAVMDHEEQHVFKRLILETAQIFHTPEQLISSDPSQQEEALRGLFSNARRSIMDAQAKDEILAYMTDPKQDYFTLYATLTKSADKKGLYDYYDMSKDQFETRRDRLLDSALKDAKDLSDEEKLERKRSIQLMSDKVANFVFKDTYQSTLLNALSAHWQLERAGYSREEIRSYLIQESLVKWPRAARNLLEKEPIDTESFSKTVGFGFEQYLAGKDINQEWKQYIVDTFDEMHRLMFKADQSDPEHLKAVRNLELLQPLEELFERVKDAFPEQYVQYKNLLSITYFHIAQNKEIANEPGGRWLFDNSRRCAQENAEFLEKFISEKSGVEDTDTIRLVAKAQQGLPRYRAWQEYTEATAAYLDGDLQTMETLAAHADSNPNAQIIRRLYRGLLTHKLPDYERDYYSTNEEIKD